MTSEPRFQSSNGKGLWLLLLPVIIIIIVYSQLPHEQELGVALSPDSQIEKLSQPQFSLESSSPEETNEMNSTRLFYPYSVIKGGIRDAEELKNAIQKDPVVAEHYSDFNLAKTKVVSLPHERFAYVSYRMNDQVYWTKRKLKLAKGETVLTDGKNYARGRCGNRITEVSQANTSPHEPKPQVFDTPIKLDTAVPLRMAYSPEPGSLQLPPGLIMQSGETSTEIATAALGSQSGGGSGFYGGGPGGFVGGYIPGPGVGGGGGSPGGGSGGTSSSSGPGGSTSPVGGGKSSGSNGGSGYSGSPGGVVGGGDSGNQGNGQGSPGGSGSNSSTPPITSNENGLPNNPSGGSGSPGNGSRQGGNDSSTSGAPTPPTGNGGETIGGDSTGPTSHNPGNDGDNPGNSGNIHPPGNSDTLPPPRDFTQPSDTGDTSGTNSIALTTLDSPPPTQVPEPSTLVLMVSGLAGYLALKKLSKKKSS